MMFPFLKEAVSNVFSKPSTRNFPAENVDAKPGYRGRISYDPEKCINCGTCIKVCSPSSITRTYEDVEGGKKITYEFDLTSCTFCATCQDFCEQGAIVLTPDYHMVARDPKELIVRGTRFKKQVGKLEVSDACVFCGLCAKNCPEQAITVDRKAKTWEVDHSKCVQCGKCIEKCPKHALQFGEYVPQGVLWDEEKCVYCTLCAKKCPNECISVDRKEKTWAIDRTNCVQCGICVEKCPKDALVIGDLKE